VLENFKNAVDSIENVSEVECKKDNKFKGLKFDFGDNSIAFEKQGYSYKSLDFKKEPKRSKEELEDEDFFKM